MELLHVSNCCWLSLTISPGAMELLHVSHCLLWLLAVSHCLSDPMELLYVSYCLSLFQAFPYCPSDPMELLHVSLCCWLLLHVFYFLFQFHGVAIIMSFTVSYGFWLSLTVSTSACCLSLSLLSHGFATCLSLSPMVFQGVLHASHCLP